MNGRTVWNGTLFAKRVLKNQPSTFSLNCKQQIQLLIKSPSKSLKMTKIAAKFFNLLNHHSLLSLRNKKKQRSQLVKLKEKQSLVSRPTQYIKELMMSLSYRLNSGNQDSSDMTWKKMAIQLGGLLIFSLTRKIIICLTPSIKVKSTT